MPGQAGEAVREPRPPLEIDLLRGGRPMPLENRPRCEYSVVVSRAEARPWAGFWPIRLRQRLPIIPIPLVPGDPDAHVDLQEILDHVYDATGYEDFIYAGRPDPPLSSRDAAWARTFVPSTRRGFERIKSDRLAAAERDVRHLSLRARSASGSIQQHIVPSCRPSWEMLQVDVEERVHFHAVGADVDQPDVESPRVVEGGQQ